MILMMLVIHSLLYFIEIGIFRLSNTKLNAVLIFLMVIIASELFITFLSLYVNQYFYIYQNKNIYVDFDSFLLNYGFNLFNNIIGPLIYKNENCYYEFDTKNIVALVITSIIFLSLSIFSIIKIFFIKKESGENYGRNIISNKFSKFIPHIFMFVIDIIIGQTILSDYNFILSVILLIVELVVYLIGYYLLLSIFYKSFKPSKIDLILVSINLMFTIILICVLNLNYYQVQIDFDQNSSALIMLTA